jgi:hypothetical protein
MKQTFFTKAVQFCTAFFCVLALTGCATQPYGVRCQSELDALSHTHLFKKKIFSTPNARVLGALKVGDPNKINVYIEGDGLAWTSGSTISDDPTPTEPTALALAAQDISSSTLFYLARPAQYIRDDRLDFTDWTSGRYSQKIVDVYHTILDQYKAQHPHVRITVLGYSGGGTLALLLAAQRRDISRVITFAGLLDPEQWVDIHDYTPLSESLNPVNYIRALSTVPQTHYSGAQDTVVPPLLAQRYRTHFAPHAPIYVITIPGLNHWDGWPEFWAQQQPPPKNPS